LAVRAHPPEPVTPPAPAPPVQPLRLVAYTDYSYRREHGTVYAERAFALFLAELAERIDRLVLTGRLHPEPGRSHYPLGGRVEFVALPHYGSLVRPWAALPAVLRSLARFWRMLDGADGAWLLGPHGLALPFALITLARRRRLALGVRQDLPEYVRSRHPGRRWIHLAAAALESAFRRLARRHPVVVVGPGLAERYRHAPRLLETSVSLVRQDDVAGPEALATRSCDGELTILSVGRLETEKNPLLLADVLARLRTDYPRWRLVVCGEGPLAGELEDRLRALGVAEHAELRGYVPFAALREEYRRADLFLHVSWTEGLPQVLFEALAAGLPTVATAVGGVAAAVGDAVALVPRGDPAAAAAALDGLAADAQLRRRLVDRGLAVARAHTLESETARVAAFLGRTPAQA
jgi:glycosyltransferase involved in cell wall biosynthesis